MTIQTSPNDFFIFDLDDTLYPEINFLKSAYKSIAQSLLPAIGKDIYPEMLDHYQQNRNVFEWIVNQHAAQIPGLTIERLLTQYREHLPQIRLLYETELFLNTIRNKNIPMGLISDGRSVTQRNKLKALQIEDFFSDVIISEEFGTAKPHPANFFYFADKYPGRRFFYFADNTSKDFIVPAQMRWTTICMQNAGQHIHRQDINKPPQPDYVISSFAEIILQ